MKRIVISHFDIMEMTNMNGDIRIKLEEAGFDLSKVIHNKPDPVKAVTVFTQED